MNDKVGRALAIIARIEAAAVAALAAFDDEEESVRAEHHDVIEELRRALEGDDAKPDHPYDAHELELCR